MVSRTDGENANEVDADEAFVPALLSVNSSGEETFAVNKTLQSQEHEGSEVSRTISTQHESAAIESEGASKPRAKV